MSTTQNKKKIFSVIKQLVFMFGIAFVFLCLVMYFIQDSLIYHPSDADFFACPYFTEEQKQTVNETRFYEVRRSDTVAILYHGNAGSACDRIYWDGIFAEAGISTIIVEYSGYGGDGKKPSQKSILAGVEIMADYASTYTTSVLVGESIGSGPASYHASVTDPSLLILLAPFDSLANNARMHYPYLPVRLLLKGDYDNVRWLADRTATTVLIHGDKDVIVYPTRSKKLFDSLLGDKQYYSISGADHNNLLSQDVEQLVQEYLIQHS